jgi:hypothetical protein
VCFISLRKRIQAKPLDAPPTKSGQATMHIFALQCVLSRRQIAELTPMIFNNNYIKLTFELLSNKIEIILFNSNMNSKSNFEQYFTELKPK